MGLWMLWDTDQFGMRGGAWRNSTAAAETRRPQLDLSVRVAEIPDIDRLRGSDLSCGQGHGRDAPECGKRSLDVKGRSPTTPI